MKKVTEATETLNGDPVLIHRTNVPKDNYPIHGAVWVEQGGKQGWLPVKWDKDGECSRGGGGFDLFLFDWRDNIPWSYLDPRIVAIARTSEDGYWCGYFQVPQLSVDGWCLMNPSKVNTPPWGRLYLEGLYIPNAPSDWRKTLAIRSGYGVEE